MLKLHHDKYLYDESLDFLHLEHVFSKDYVILMDISLMSDMFLDLQKDIFQEYFSLLVSRLESETEEKHIRQTVEHTLQELNAKLTLFADRIDKIDYFGIKGAIRVFHKNMLVGSLIGDTSMMIFRGDELYYAVSNDYDNIERIDLFSEFVEGETLSGDQMILLGYDIHTIFDKHELKKFNNLFSLQHGDVVDFLEEIVAMRVDLSLAGFMLRTIRPQDEEKKGESAIIKSKAEGVVQKAMERVSGLIGSKIDTNNINRESYRYPLVIGLLGLVVVILGIGLFSHLINSRPLEMKLSDGTTEIVDAASIRRDLEQFKHQQPGDTKNHLYTKIINKIDFLAKEKPGIEDIELLRNKANERFQSGFNIVQVSNFTRFDSTDASESAEIIAFTEDEKASVGEPLNVFAENGKVQVIGQKGAMLDIIDGDRRGSPLPYDFKDDTLKLKKCTANLLKNGVYCVDTVDAIHNLTKAGVETLVVDGDRGFPGAILDIGTFGKSSFYTLTRSAYENQDNIYIVRYRNVLGSQVKFTKPVDYPVIVASGVNLDPKSMTIAPSFLMRDSGQVHHWYRAGRGLAMTDRPIALKNGFSNKYESDVEILTNDETRYTFLFDKSEQTLTVYDSVGLKTAPEHSESYDMKYIMRFNFTAEKPVLDVTLDNSSANVPVLYVMTPDGVHKINMMSFLEDIVDPVM